MRNFSTPFPRFDRFVTARCSRASVGFQWCHFGHSFSHITYLRDSLCDREPRHVSQQQLTPNTLPHVYGMFVQPSDLPYLHSTPPLRLLVLVFVHHHIQTTSYQKLFLYPDGAESSGTTELVGEPRRIALAYVTTQHTDGVGLAHPSYYYFSHRSTNPGASRPLWPPPLWWYRAPFLPNTTFLRRGVRKNTPYRVSNGGHGMLGIGTCLVWSRRRATVPPSSNEG